MDGQDRSVTDTDAATSLQILDLPRSAPERAPALPVLDQLRAHLTVELLDQVLREGQPQGLRFIAALNRNACVGVASWRILANTSGIRILYVDDVVSNA